MQEVEEEEDEEEVLDAGDEKQKRREAEKELRAAVDKIYELRDIIRSLETQMEAKVKAQVQQQETVAELKVALEEAVLGHTLVHQELELLRSSSSDVEFVEHIKALEEQLSLKTAEVTKQRFASAQVQELRMQLRGLEERVGQSTRELELSLAGERSTQSSPGSSRRSTPNLLTAGGSFEDMGGGGLEVEEVARLEARVRSLEKAEAGAVDRVRKLDEERRELKALLQKQEEKWNESVVRMEEQDILVTSLQNEVSKMKETQAVQEKERKQLELLAERGEEIEAERELLQQRVVE